MLIRGSSGATGSWKTILFRPDATLGGDVLAVEQDPAGGQRRQSDRGPGKRRLAGARFADQADDFALADVQVDVLNGAHRGRAPAEADRDVGEVQVLTPWVLRGRTVGVDGRGRVVDVDGRVRLVDVDGPGTPGWQARSRRCRSAGRPGRFADGDTPPGRRGRPGSTPGPAPGRWRPRTGIERRRHTRRGSRWGAAADPESWSTVDPRGLPVGHRGEQGAGVGVRRSVEQRRHGQFLNDLARRTSPRTRSPSRPRPIAGTSCKIGGMLAQASDRTPAMRWRTCCWTVTSKAVVGSSAISSDGRSPSDPCRSSPAAAFRRRTRNGYWPRTARRPPGYGPPAAGDTALDQSLGPRGALVLACHLGELLADLHGRVERAHRVLEDRAIEFPRRFRTAAGEAGLQSQTPSNCSRARDGPGEGHGAARSPAR